MKQLISSSLLVLIVAVAAPARAQTPAARVGDPTTHGGTIVGPGVPSVLIEGQAAAVVGDQTTCPLSNGVTPHVGGPLVTASATVFIGGKRAARVGDANVENGSSATISTGASTVVIGN
jgi:uncharacterized Zn-binding protein involved in type VI secretion